MALNFWRFNLWRHQNIEFFWFRFLIMTEVHIFTLNSAFVLHCNVLACLKRKLKWFIIFGSWLFENWKIYFFVIFYFFSKFLQTSSQVWWYQKKHLCEVVCLLMVYTRVKFQGHSLNGSGKHLCFYRVPKKPGIISKIRRIKDIYYTLWNIKLGIKIPKNVI